MNKIINSVLPKGFAYLVILSLMVASVGPQVTLGATRPLEEAVVVATPEIEGVIVSPTPEDDISEVVLREEIPEIISVEETLIDAPRMSVNLEIERTVREEDSEGVMCSDMCVTGSTSASGTTGSGASTPVEPITIPEPSVRDLDGGGSGGGGGSIISVDDRGVTLSHRTKFIADTRVFNPKYLGSISGTVFNDSNENGKFGPGENGLSGWEVELYKVANNEFVASYITGSDGRYIFNDLPVGTYTVDQKMQNAWIETAPSTSYGHSITLNQTTQAFGRDFGVIKYASISGYLWHDLNGDGIWQDDAGVDTEPGLGSWLVQAGEVPVTLIDAPPTGGLVGGAIGTGTDSPDSTLSGTTGIDGSATGPNLLTSYEATTDVSGLYQFLFPFHEIGEWNITPVLPNEHWMITSPDGQLSSSVTLDTATEDVETVNFGIIPVYDIFGALFSPMSGDDTSTSQVLVLNDVVISIPFGGGESTITLFKGTHITESTGANFDINNFVAEGVAPASMTGLGTNVVVDGALQWGIPNIELIFDTEIIVALYVGSSLDGQTLDIVRSTSGTSAWTSDGIASPATCIVAGGLCTFNADKASHYVGTHTVSVTPPTPPTPPGGGGGGSIGGPFIPPTTPEDPSEAPTAPIGSTGGEQFISLPDITAFSQTLAQTVGNAVPTLILSDTEANITDGVETILDIEPSTDESPVIENPNAGFLALTGNFLTLGTGNVWIGILILLILAFLIFMIGKTSRKKSEK